MGYRGFLKPKLRWPIVLGFFCGIMVGASMTYMVHTFCAEHRLDDKRLTQAYEALWTAVLLPATLLHVLNLGVPAYPYPADLSNTAPALLRNAAITNGLLTGLILAFLSKWFAMRWSVTAAEKADRASHQPKQVLSLKRMLLTNACVGFSVGAFGTLTLAGVGWLLGVYGMIVLWFPLSTPFHHLCTALDLNWSNRHPETTGETLLSFVIGPFFVNGVLMSLLFLATSGLKRAVNKPKR